MKIKSIFLILCLASILSGCEIRHAAVYVEEPATEVVIIEGRPVRRIIVAPRPIVIRRHHH